MLIENTLIRSVRVERDFNYEAVVVKYSENCEVLAADSVVELRGCKSQRVLNDAAKRWKEIERNERKMDAENERRIEKR